jgi:hypothetical protein
MEGTLAVSFEDGDTPQEAARQFIADLYAEYGMEDM